MEPPFLCHFAVFMPQNMLQNIYNYIYVLSRCKDTKNKLYTQILMQFCRFFHIYAKHN